MEVNKELEESDRQEPADKRTFTELSKIANTLYSFVQLTTDTPSSHQAGMCPVLDLQMWVNEEGQLMYKFYSKQCSSKFVIPAESAHSKQMKMSVFVEKA